MNERDKSLLSKIARYKKNRYFWIFLLVFVYILFSIFIYLIDYFENVGKKKVVIYELKGIITTEDKPNSIVMDKVIKDLKRLNKSYDGIIIKINSPGGDAYATKKIAEVVKKISEGKPIVSCVDEIATSGAYWVISQTDYIVADEFSIVGSIGVFSSYLDFAGLLDKLGIHYNRLVWGKYKDMLTPFKNLTEDEKTLFMNKTKFLYEYFVKEVAEGRGLDYNYTKKLATGEFFFGKEALDKGLIDEFGDLNTCKLIIAEDLNTSLKNIKFDYIKGYRKQEFNLFGLSMAYGFAKAIIEYLNENNIKLQ